MKSFATFVLVACLAIHVAAQGGSLIVLSFDAAGGSVSPQSVTVQSGSAIGPLPEANRSGRVFLGWFTEADGGDMVSELTQVEQDTTLYAHWARSSYKIAFDANGGKGTMRPVKVSYGTAAKLPKNAFSRSGRVFCGWSATKNGPVAWKDKASVRNLTENGGTVTLYARWAVKSYKVKFHANDGKGSMLAQSMQYGKAAKLSVNLFSRRNRYFAGWAKTLTDAKAGIVTFSNEQSVKNLVTNGATVKLYAVWKKHDKYVPKTEGRIRFALCQIPCGKFAASKRIDKTFAWARKSLRGNEDVIVFPELTFAMFSELTTAWRQAPTVWKKAAAFAKERNAWVIVNNPTRPDGCSRMYNETRVFAPDGRVVAVYRKRNLARMDEKAGFSPGPGAVLAELPFARIGLLICKDAFIPSRGGGHYKNADLLLVQFAHPGVDNRNAREAAGFPTAARSRDDLRDTRNRWSKYGKPYMAVNKIGSDGNYRLCGGTFAARISTRIVAKVDVAEKVLFVDFPLDADGRIKPTPSIGSAR